MLPYWSQYVWARESVCKRMRGSVCTFMYKYIFTYISTYLDVYILAHIHIHIYVYTYIYIYIYIAISYVVKIQRPLFPDAAEDRWSSAVAAQPLTATQPHGKSAQQASIFDLLLGHPVLSVFLGEAVLFHKLVEVHGGFGGRHVISKVVQTL